MSQQNAIYLASSSPRRRQLLEQINVAYTILPVAIDETWYPQESPEHHVIRLAQEKAQAGWNIVITDKHPVLGADTVVVLDGKVLGKAIDKQSTLEMLIRLSGQVHAVYTGVAIKAQATGEIPTKISKTNVYFESLSEEQIELYWQSGEPLGKAGAYAIQGFAASFIQRIEGSYSGVMGLPLFETAELLKTVGIDVLPVRPISI